jgi:hypothetical protein
MASMADVQYSHIYKGPWIDWSKGAFKGATITVTSTNGAVVVAFQALFVAFAGQHLWGLICFAWYQYRMTDGSKRALEHQQDVALRNNASPPQTLWHFVLIAWSWRGHTERWWVLGVLPIGVPLALTTLVVVAGIWSSTIVKTTNVDVLIRGSDCGLWKLPDEQAFKDQAEYMIENNKYIRNLAEFSKQYERACYYKPPGLEAETCKAFTTPSIPYLTSLNASCPFDKSVCTFPGPDNLEMDTLLIDTNKVLGINTNKHNLDFRKSTVCAPIKPDIFTTTTSYDRVGRISRQNTSSPHQFTQWKFGNYTNPDPTSEDFIFQVDKYQAEITRYYTIDTPTHFHMDPDVDVIDQSAFFPIAEFNVTDGDLKILFLQSNGIITKAACDDPWFSAHQAFIDPIQNNRTMYKADHLAVPMGCVEKYQFCNPHQNGACTLLTSILPAIGSAKRTLNLSPLQSATVDLFFNAIYMLNTDIFVPSYHTPNLLAEQSAMKPYQMPLPSNQWVLELQDMHNTVLAMLQRDVVDYARGPGSKESQQFIETPQLGPKKQLCSMIRARADGRFANISTYGLAITLALGTLIILTNLFIVSIISYIDSHRNVHSAKIQAWLADGLHQQQRRLFEAHREGIWEGDAVSVPVTVHGDMIARSSAATKAGNEMREMEIMFMNTLNDRVYKAPPPGRLKRSGIARVSVIEAGEAVTSDLEFGATLTEQDWETRIQGFQQRGSPQKVENS